MSLTLPYPDMVFVPLDILTAQELNEIVSNVEYISDQFPISSANIANNAVNTAQVANAAVTADKIDFGTFSEAISSTTSSITLQTGKWALFYEVQVYQTSATTDSVLTMNFTSVSEMPTVTWAVPSTSGQNFYSVITKCSIATVSTSTTITRTFSTQTNVSIGSQKWLAIPILN